MNIHVVPFRLSPNMLSIGKHFNDNLPNHRPHTERERENVYIWCESGCGSECALCVIVWPNKWSPCHKFYCNNLTHKKTCTHLHRGCVRRRRRILDSKTISPITPMLLWFVCVCTRGEREGTRCAFCHFAGLSTQVDFHIASNRTQRIQFSQHRRTLFFRLFFSSCVFFFDFGMASLCAGLSHICIYIHALILHCVRQPKRPTTNKKKKKWIFVHRERRQYKFDASTMTATEEAAASSWL